LVAAALVLAVAAGAAWAVRGPAFRLGQRLAAPVFGGRPAGHRLDPAEREAMIRAAYALAVRGTLVSAGFALAGGGALALAARGRKTAAAAALVVVTALDVGAHAWAYTASEPMERFF